MKFSAACPHCNARLDVESRLSGRPVTCPGCNERFTCPDPPAPDMPVADSPPPPGDAKPEDELAIVEIPVRLPSLPSLPSTRTLLATIAVLLVTIVVLLVIGVTSVAPQPQWEYQWGSEGLSSSGKLRDFDDYGERGWEMVGWQYDRNGEPQALFKRKKSND